MDKGRPTKYKEEYCQKIIEYMSEGNSVTSFAAEIDVCKDTIYEWAKVHPKFSDSLKKATAKCEKYWEKIGMENLITTGQHVKFNSAVWIFWMKARFGWRDRDESKKDDEERSFPPLSYNENDL